MSAVVLKLGGDDIEDGVPDREQVDGERGKVKWERKRRETKRGQTTHAQTFDIMDDMWMERMRTETP